VPLTVTVPVPVPVPAAFAFSKYPGGAANGRGGQRPPAAPGHIAAPKRPPETPCTRAADRL